MTGKLHTYASVTDVTGPETFPVVITPDGGSAGTAKISAFDLARSSAFTSQFTTAADLTALDARVTALEEGGVVQSSTSLVSIAGGTAYADFSSLALLAGELNLNDRLIHFCQGDFLNDSAGAVLIDFEWGVGATPFRLSGIPSAGFSEAQNTVAGARRSWVSFMQLTVISATTFNVLSSVEISSLPGAVGDPSLFNGTTTSRHTVRAISDASLNTANAMTIHFRGKNRTAGTGTDIVLRSHESTWSVVKA